MTKMKREEKIRYEEAGPEHGEEQAKEEAKKSAKSNENSSRSCFSVAQRLEHESKHKIQNMFEDKHRMMKRKS